MYVMVIFALVGLGVLLYGMTLFGKALEPALNYGLGRRFTKVAGNPVGSYFVSSAITFITQKVTLPCGMVMGFVDVGTISPKQSIAFVLGISFGSALSMILLMFNGLNLTLYLTLFCFIGAIILLFIKNPRAQHIAQGMMGFGLLFLGLELVGTYATQLFALPAVFDFLSMVSNPFVIILIGFLISLITTSTFASLTVLAALVGATAGAGPISIDVAYLGMLAVTIGAGLSDYIYTISGQSTQAKRVVTFHVLFRVFSFLICLPLFFTPVIDMLYVALGENAVMTLIIVHMVQMTIPSFLLLPFGKPLAKLMEKIVPDRKSKDDLVAEFVLPDNAVSVFGVGYPSLLKSVSRLLEINAEAQGLLFERFAGREMRGSLGRLKSIEKAVKITSNSTIRLSSKAGENELPKLNVLINIMGDLHYLGERSLKLYSISGEIIKKSKSLSEEQLKALVGIFEEIKEQYQSDIALVDTLINGQDISNKQLRDKMTSNKALYARCQKLKHRTISEYRKTGKYPRGSDTYFELMLIMEDINTDLANIAIKLGILSG